MRSVLRERATCSSRVWNQRMGSHGSSWRTRRRMEGMACSGAPRTLI
jgi:hypothetical protein